MPLSNRGYALDYGCGTGYGTELLALQFRYTYGIDKDERALAYARRVHSRSGVLYFNSLEQLPLKDPRFDLISCIEMIEHMPLEEAYVLLDRFKYLLDPDGTFILTTPHKNPDAKPNQYHQHEFTPEELENVLGNRFRVVEVQDISMGIPNLIAICREPKK